MYLVALCFTYGLSLSCDPRASANLLYEQSSPEMQGAASPPPSIVLQRKATDLSKLDDAGQRIETVPAPTMESIPEPTPNPAPRLVRSTDASPPPLPADVLKSSGALKSLELSTQTGDQPRSTPNARVESQQTFSPISQRSTEPISTTSTNSRIRMVDNRRKRGRIKSFDDVHDVPGAEVLVFDRDQKRWRVRRKSEVSCKSYASSSTLTH